MEIIVFRMTGSVNGASCNADFERFKQNEMLLINR